MKVRLYKSVKRTGWLGWIENCMGQAVGFIKPNGFIVWEW